MSTPLCGQTKVFYSDCYRFQATPLLAVPRAPVLIHVCMICRIVRVSVPASLSVALSRCRPKRPRAFPRGRLLFTRCLCLCVCVRVCVFVYYCTRGAGTRLNGAPFDVYYEYVRQPCVELSYFDNPVKIMPRYYPVYNRVRPMCANPKAAVATAGCCKNTTAKQLGQCFSEYSDELVTRATAEARCKDFGNKWEPCAKEAVPGKDAPLCFCPKGGQARFGYDHFYASNWSDPVTIGSRAEIQCNRASFQHDPGYLEGKCTTAHVPPRV